MSEVCCDAPSPFNHLTKTNVRIQRIIYEEWILKQEGLSSFLTLFCCLAAIRSRLGSYFQWIDFGGVWSSISVQACQTWPLWLTVYLELTSSATGGVKWSGKRRAFLWAMADRCEDAQLLHNIKFDHRKLNIGRWLAWTEHPNTNFRG